MDLYIWSLLCNHCFHSLFPQLQNLVFSRTFHDYLHCVVLNDSSYFSWPEIVSRVLLEAYYEEQMGALIDSMLLQAHVLGGGVIGQTALMKNHRWMYSDEIQERQIL